MNIKRLRFLALLIAALVAFGAVGAVAQEKAKRGASMTAERFKQLDKNGDGVLTKDEFDRPKWFDRLDANKDGKVTLEEAQAAQGKWARGKRGNRGAGSPTPTQADVKYGPHERNVLDFWQAKSDKPTPLVVYIHGGGFVGGDKTQVPMDAVKKALDAGASVISISYRFRKDAPIQDILRDCARAVQFMRLNAAKFNIDPKRVGCFGGSAGAGSSLWLAVHDDLADPKSEDPVLRQSTRISAAACNNGQATYDLVEWEKIIYPFKPEWKSNPTEIADFYHFKSDADFQTDAGRKILADCSMYSLLSKDDAPIWMYCSLPDGEPADRNQILHHPKHVQVIKKRADELGVKCETVYDVGRNQNAWMLAVEFLLKNLPPETPPAS